MFTEITMINFTRPLAKRKRTVTGPYRWRPSAPNKGRGFYCSQHDALTMDRAGSTIRLRLEWANDHLSGRIADITGYYCDEHGDGDTLQPVIARLPRGRGYLAGWTMGAGMCGAVDSTVYETEESAAYAAHSMAEYDAEESIRANAREREEEERAVEHGYASCGVYA